MSTVLYALGRWAFRAKWLVLSIWVGALLVVGALAGLVGTGTVNTYAIPGTESQQALDSLNRTFAQISGATAQLIVVAPPGTPVTDPSIQGPVTNELTSIAAIPQVIGVSAPYASTTKDAINPDSSAVLASVQLDGPQSAIAQSTVDALLASGTALQDALPPGSQVSVGGQLYSSSGAGISITELLGIAIAFVVLVITFASFIAAGMPLVAALLGVGLSISLILITTRFTVITSTTPLLALMLGLAVGIDYSLFIISRHQAQVKQGMAPEESAARSIATAGSAVVFAALTVIIALVGLSVARIPFLTTMGIGAAVAVAMAVLISMTLTPALLGIVGVHVVAKRYRQRAVVQPDAETEDAQAEAVDAQSDTDDAQAEEPAPDEPHAAPLPKRGFFLTWVRVVTTWPIVTVIAVVVLLGLATVPAASLKLALPDAGSNEPGTPSRVTYDLIADYFGPGYNGPLLVTGSVIQSSDPVGLMNDIGADIATIPGVAAVPVATPNQPGDTGIVQVIPEGAPSSEQTKDLVASIRSMHDAYLAKYGVDLSVTGFTAAGIDISAQLAGALLPFAILVVGLSLVLSTMVFRSIAVPIKAALGYLLSVGVAFGVTALVYEDGFLAGPLGVTSQGAVISFMPIIVMGVLFGLAMDYEVFLVSRIREDYVLGRDAHHSIETGFVGSAKVVTAAAIIMFSVFAAFIPNGDASIQPIALGLAVGVAVDAFIVRMTLVPAVLMLLGDHAWWIPAWLDRVLPKFDIEGEGLHRELAAASWPALGDEHVIVADSVEIRTRSGAVLQNFSALVASGETLLIAGPVGSGKTAALLALSGRTPITGGEAKVCGFVLPTRAAAVRSRSGFVRCLNVDDPAAAVRVALRRRPRVLVIDDLDAVLDPEARKSIAAELGAAVAAWPLTVVASCARPEWVAEALPPGRGRTQIVQLEHPVPVTEAVN